MDPRRPACPALVPDQDGGAGKGEQNEAACREAPASTTRNGARRLSEAIRGNAAPRDGLFVGRGAGGPLSPSCLSFAVIFLPREVLIPLNYGFFFFFTLAPLRSHWGNQNVNVSGEVMLGHWHCCGSRRHGNDDAHPGAVVATGSGEDHGGRGPGST